MEIGKAFTFVNEDQDWIKKVAIGALFVFIPFLILLVIGYQILIVRNVIDGKDRPLPEWEDFGQLFIDGLIMMVTIFVYALPVILISLCAVLISIGTTDSSGQLSGGGVAGIGVLSCLGFLLAIALAFITPALYIQYARTGEFGPMFRIGEVIAIAREHLVDILIVILVAMVANLVVSFLGSLLSFLCVGVIILLAGTAWIMFATAHLYGQIGRKMADKSLQSDYSPA